MYLQLCNAEAFFYAYYSNILLLRYIKNTTLFNSFYFNYSNTLINTKSMIVNEKKKQVTENVNVENRALHSIVSVRFRNDQLAQLRAEAKKENRTFSNYVVTKLFS